MKEKIKNMNNLNHIKNRNLILIENTKILLADKEDCNVKETDFRIRFSKYFGYL